jgi:hypothetical protein
MHRLPFGPNYLLLPIHPNASTVFQKNSVSFFYFDLNYQLCAQLTVGINFADVQTKRLIAPANPAV